MTKVSLTTIGCKLNQFETMAIAEMFRNKKFDIVPFQEKADIYIINSCTVTGRSDYKSRNAARRARRIGGEEALIVLTGCYAQRDPEFLSTVSEIDAVIGNSHKHLLTEIVEHLLIEKDITGKHGKSIHVAQIDVGRIFRSNVTNFGKYTRAFLKVQDGCDYRCTYCAVPEARGPGRSVPLSEVVRFAKGFVEEGYKEIVLTGVNLGMFGADRGESFESLIVDLCEIDGLERLRLSSIEPMEFDKKLIEILHREEKVAPHFHIPLQSGSGRILKSMDRRYTPEEYRQIVTELASGWSHPGIGADVMVGFPGETEKDFMETYNLIESLPITYLHVFSYSKRTGTPAAEFPDQVDSETKKDRSRLLKELSKKINLKFRKSLVGTEERVLFEGKTGEGNEWTGLSGNYTRMIVESNTIRRGELRKVMVSEVKPDLTVGKLVTV